MDMSGQERKSADIAAQLSPSENDRLRSWKEIAAFFGCTERTVRRWEETRGLPVRRLPNGPRSAVFAYRDELQSWLTAGNSTIAEAGAESDAASAAPVRMGERPMHLRLGVWLGISIALIAALGLAAVLLGWLGTASPAKHIPNAQAQAFYRAGLYGWQSRTPAGLTHAVDDFTQAIVRDPLYAEAYAGLANCYNLLREYTAMPPDYAFPRAKAAAERAIALDPSLADGHLALAFADFWWSHDAPAARREFERAVLLAPQNATAHHWYATFLMNFREFPQALVEIDKAQQLDSESSSILADKGDLLFRAGRVDEAISLLQQLEQTAPQLSSPHSYLAFIYRARGDDVNFLREFAMSAQKRQHQADQALAAAAAEGFASGGHHGMLLAMLQVQQRRFSEFESPRFALAGTYADLGSVRQSLHYLILSLQKREPDAMTFNIEPAFEPLRNTPEFRRLLKSTGLNSYQR